MKNERSLISLIILGFALCMCAQKATNEHHSEKGIASFYSDRLHGRQMSNGNTYHRDSFTCAHKRYPLGTLLKVRNPLNERECIVRVTDRGPHNKKFTIDLSRAAAKHLGILSAGFAQVEITPYFSGVVPYKMKEPDWEEIPELDINYIPVATYPGPLWQQQDSIPESLQTTP